MRTPRDDYFLDLALRCAHQGTCMRRNFGSVIVDNSGTIISTGYSGAPRNMPDCIEIGHCWREEHNIPSGQNYEKCRSVHSEMNALLQAGKNARDCSLYLAGFDVKTNEIVEILPCFLCSKMIINSEIKYVYIKQKEGYKRHSPVDIYRYRLKEAFGNTD